MLSAFDAWLTDQNPGLVLLVFLIICLVVFTRPNQDTKNYRQIFHPKKKKGK